MTTHTDPITTAVRLLKAAASSEHLAAAQALQDFAESLGAGGIQPLVSRRNVTGAIADIAPTAINSGAEAIPTGRTGCTAGTDQECANRACATHCPALAPQQAAPAGWVPVPLELTEKMRAAGDCAWMTSDGVDSCRVFHAMLAAAPKAPKQAAPGPGSAVRLALEREFGQPAA